MMAFLKFNLGHLNLIQATESCLPLAQMGHPHLKLNNKSINDIVSLGVIFLKKNCIWCWMLLLGLLILFI